MVVVIIVIQIYGLENKGYKFNYFFLNEVIFYLANNLGLIYPTYILYQYNIYVG